MQNPPEIRDTVAAEFVARCVVHLEEEYLPRIGRSLEVLPAGDLWHKPHANTTSVGNLLLHLEGNVRQWLLVGLGGQSHRRDRDAEFAADASHATSAAELFARLESTVTEACRLIEGLPERELLRAHEIQVFEGVSGLAAVLHVVEHFAWHTGQIAWIAKERAGQAHALSFYDDDALNPED